MKFEYKVLVDIDNKDIEDELSEMSKVNNVIGDMYKITSVKVRETEKGFHVYITIESDVALKPITICLLQCLFGSDRKREAFNLLRIRQGIAYWNVLFAEKWDVIDGKRQILSLEKPRPDLEELFMKKLEVKI